MSSNYFYKCVVKTEYEDARGKIKHRRDEYIVEGISPTDVEAKITEKLIGEEFEIAQITMTKILDIIK